MHTAGDSYQVYSARWPSRTQWRLADDLQLLGLVEIEVIGNWRTIAERTGQDRAREHYLTHHCKTQASYADQPPGNLVDFDVHIFGRTSDGLIADVQPQFGEANLKSRLLQIYDNKIRPETFITGVLDVKRIQGPGQTSCGFENPLRDFKTSLRQAGNIRRALAHEPNYHSS